MPRYGRCFNEAPIHESGKLEGGWIVDNRSKQLQ